MTIAVGVLAIAVCGLLYVGQVISTVSFRSAQRWGLQEPADDVDPLFSRLELWTARWDLVWLWTLPLAGVLMIADHSWWPAVALLGGGAFVDAAGREGAKWLGLRDHGVDLGSTNQRRAFWAAMASMAVVGGLTAAAGVAAVV